MAESAALFPKRVMKPRVKKVSVAGASKMNAAKLKGDMVREVLLSFLTFEPAYQEALIAEMVRRRSSVRLFQSIKSGSLAPNTAERKKRDREEMFEQLMKEMKDTATYTRKALCGKKVDFTKIKRLLDVSREKGEFEAVLNLLNEMHQGDAIMHAYMQGRVLKSLRTEVEGQKEKWSAYLCRIRANFRINISYRDAERKIRWFDLAERFPKLLNSTVAVRRLWNSFKEVEEALDVDKGDEALKAFWSEEIKDKLPMLLEDSVAEGGSLSDGESSTETAEEDSDSSEEEEDEEQTVLNRLGDPEEVVQVEVYA